MDLRVDPHALVPPSQQLVAAVLDAIAGGELPPGERLPSVRAAAAQALVNPNTVAKAWRDLEHLGVTEGRNGSGVFVTAAGPDVARALRLSATLDEFGLAVARALRAGHDAAVLLHEVQRAAAQREVAREAARGAARDAAGERGERERTGVKR